MSWYAEFGDQVRPDVPLAPLTWFGLGGPAKFFVQPRDLPSLQAIVARLRENEIPMHVLGSGANLLVNDAGVDGAVICLNTPEFKKVYEARGLTMFTSSPKTMAAEMKEDGQRFERVIKALGIKLD